MKRCVRSIVLIACATLITAVAVAGPARWSANGHYYQAVRVGTPISWADANQAAKALGPGWHLATITSAEEDVFVRGLFGDPLTRPTFWSPSDPVDDSKSGPWIGGYHVIRSKTFQWVTGEPVLFSALVYPIFTDARISYSYNVGWAGTVDWQARDPRHEKPIAYIAELSAPTANPGLELTKTTVAGCKNVTGRVNISMPAPAGGLVVRIRNTLSSASTPESLTIPAGATSQSFQIKTSAVREMQTGEISATFGGKKYRRQLIVRPMGLQSLALSATDVLAGQLVTGTARLECEAGPGPVTVRLGSSDLHIAAPVAESIVIPQGVQSETFDIETYLFFSGSTWIFGTANKITKSQRLDTLGPY